MRAPVLPLGVAAIVVLLVLVVVIGGVAGLQVSPERPLAEEAASADLADERLDTGVSSHVVHENRVGMEFAAALVALEPLLVVQELK